MKTGTTRANTTTTKGFEPRGLNRNRLPFKVVSCPGLSAKMEAHLRVLLTSDDYRAVATQPASPTLSSNYESLIRYCGEHVEEEPLISENDKNNLSSRMAGPVKRAYFELTRGTLHFKGQIPTTDAVIKVDRCTT